MAVEEDRQLLGKRRPQVDPERLPLFQVNTDRPATPCVEERSERRVNFDPRGSYPQVEGGALQIGEPQSRGGY